MDSAWRPRGIHSIRVVEDTVEVRQRGIMNLAEALEYFNWVEAVTASHGYSLCLFDQNQAAGITPEARNFIGQRAKELDSPTAMAAFGGSLAMRTVGWLMIRAINMIRRPPILMGFFSMESDARAYLSIHRNEFRVRLLGAAGSRPP